MFRSIRWRLAASYAILILLSVTLMGTFALWFVQRYAEGKEREYLEANARSVALQAEGFLAPQVRRIALGELASTSAFLGDVRVRILSGTGDLLADSGDPGTSDEFLWVIPSGLAEIDAERKGASPFILSMPPTKTDEPPKSSRDIMPLLGDLPLGSSHIYARRVPTPWGRRFFFEGATPQAEGQEALEVPRRRLISITVPVGDAEGALGSIELSSPVSLGAEILGPLRSGVLFAGLGSLVVAVAFGLLVGKTVSDPLLNLASAARRMAGGDLAARAREGRTDELGALARQFNSMAVSLEASFRDLRAERDSLSRFVADASHELRTPITALATFNELMQGSASEDPQARQEFLAESHSQIRRLEWITSNLLDLSRLDAGIASLTLREHAAVDLLASAAAAHRHKAEEKRISLTIEPAEPRSQVLVCDGERMELALSNLLANAIKFTPHEGTVTMRAEAQGQSVRFSVSDNGPGIDPGDLPHIFDRFFRGKNRTTEGAGLGLAIVASVAKAHGGTISVESVPGKGSSFRLEVPATHP